MGPERVAFARFAWDADLAARLLRTPFVRVLQALDDGHGAAYATAGRAESTLREALPSGAPIAQLERTLDRAGAAAGGVARFHYIVATDVETVVEADFNAWYDQEHLPGLAAVPGTIRASRYVNAEPGAGPRHFACYDLETRETFGSPAWLAVRGSAWSSRVRPAFRNTQRTLFRIVHE